MSENNTPGDFIRARVQEDIASGRFGGRVHTRFPPEPNGYLHIGHAKAIAIDFDIAGEYGGKCNLRFDDTNPVKEEQHYVDQMFEDIHWLGYNWDGLYYASDYFGQLYDWAVQLIKQGDAYVDDLTPDEVREYRGTLTEPGRNSPYRERSVEENLDLFARMRVGEFPEGARTLRAKIDMASPNIIMRDPVMYRILHAEHHRTGDAWCIYPMYDWAHGQSDSIEGITHSLCSLEYEIHRPLYDWFLARLGIYAPQQIEFARLDLTYTVVSKRFLKKLVDEGVVVGWDDPRMPTLSALRRRGYTPAAIRNFIAATGVAKSNSIVELQQLEYFVREDLNKITLRAMAVLHPLRLIITNYPPEQTEQFEVATYPQDGENTVTRPVPFTRELYIEQEDFAELPPRGWKRMSPGREIRLYGAYFVTATDVEKDADGNIIAVHATYDSESRGGSTPDGRRPKGTIHWVSADHAVPATFNLYSTLFNVPDPGAATGNFFDDLNPQSLVVVRGYAEPGLADTQPGDRFQFMRDAYYCTDLNSTPGNLVFNRTVTLRDSWARANS